YVAGDTRGGDANFSTPHLVGRVVVVRSLAPIPRAYRRLGRLCPAPFVGEPALQRALFALQPLVRRDILALFCVPAALRVTVATAPEPRRASADANCIRGQRVEQRAIVRYDDPDSTKHPEPCEQEAARCAIEMVSRFV